MRKILLVSGESNSDPYYFCDVYGKERSEVITWPDIVAEKLNLELVNLSKYGTGNDYIFDSLIDGIIKYGQNIKAIIVPWTEISIHSFFYIKSLFPFIELNNYENPTARQWLKKVNMEKVTQNFWKSEIFDKSIYSRMINDLFTKMFILMNICKINSINLIMFQGYELIDLNTFIKFQETNNLPEKSLISEKIIEDMYVNNAIFKILEENKDILLGWPFLKSLGGDYFVKKAQENPEYRISETDYHPSEKCHREYAEKIIKKYIDVYGFNCL